MSSRLDLTFTAIKIPLDFGLILLAGLITYWLRLSPAGEALKPVTFSLPLNEFLPLLIVWAVFTVIIFSFQGLYSSNRRELSADALRIGAGLAATVLFITFLMVLQRAFFQSRFILLATAFLSFIFLVGNRLFLNQLKNYLRKKFGLGSRRILLIGKNALASQIKNHFAGNPQLGFSIVRQVNYLDFNRIRAFIKNPIIHEVILTDPHAPVKEALRLFNYCGSRAISFKFIPTALQAATAGLGMTIVAGVPLIELKRTNIEGWNRLLKRVFDLSLAGLGLIIILPIFLAIAFVIKWDSRGPILAKIRQRVGVGGKEFYMYKFRSMIIGADQLKEELLPYNEREKGAGPLFKIKNDPRLTRLGRFLRKYRLDELPQLINVIKGEMSLVGPRAHEIQEVARYREDQRPILTVKPGITGLAQISGSSDLPFEEENKLDFYYIEHWSLWLDLKIILKTAIFLFTDRSAV